MIEKARLEALSKRAFDRALVGAIRFERTTSSVSGYVANGAVPCVTTDPEWPEPHVPCGRKLVNSVR